MAETNIPQQSLADQAASEAVAPHSLAGWSAFQREVNIILPGALTKTNQLLADASRILAR
jgi:hypothetical protein